MTNIYLVLSGLGSDLQLRLRQKEVVSLKTAPMIISQRWKDCSPVLLILISRVRVNTNLNSHHFICTKEKGALFQENKNTTLNKRNGVVKVLLTLLILSFKAIEIESKWLFFCNVSTIECALLLIFSSFRHSEKVQGHFFHGPMVVGYLLKSAIQCWNWEESEASRGNIVSQVEVAFVIFDLFEILRRSSRSPPPHNILTSIFQRTQTNTVETIVKAKRVKST